MRARIDIDVDENKKCTRAQRSRYTFQKLNLFCNFIVASVYHSRDGAHASFGED